MSNIYSRTFKVTTFALMAILLNYMVAHGQKEFDGLRGTHKWMRFSDAPNALYHHLAGQAFEYLEERDKVVADFNSLQDWQTRQQQTRAILSKIVGPFPEKTPLNVRITKVIEKDNYRVENIIYESQPGFYVTTSLFIPNGSKKRSKAPAIVYCSGHTADGYRVATYQNGILNLVEKGFIVFAVDPIGQGERLQFLNPEKGKSQFRYPSYEHSYAGAPLFITGTSLARYMIWDGIRAVDYLLTRKEVDGNRIGITGRSGGGTQSALIAAMDDRIKAVAPASYITNFTRLIESMGPQCAEQDLFNGIAHGIDMADLLLVRAPKPALMITTTRDMFPIQGSIETASEVSRAYAAYGKADDFSMVMDDAAHASTQRNREAMYAFFQKHLDNPGEPAEKEVKTLSDDELRVTETGQLSTSLKGETVFSLNVKESGKRHQSLLEARKNVPAYFSGMLDSAKKLSGYREPKGAETPVFTGRIQREGYTIEKYFIKGEGDYVIPYLLMQPETPGQKALVYLHPLGKATDSQEGGEMEWFVKNGFTVLAPDLLGAGEMGPGQFRGDSYIDSVSYNIWFASMLIGRSITGIQAGDVVRLTRLLQTDDRVKEIYGLAKKQMAPVLLHAAAFDDVIANVALIEPYSSYRSIIMNRFYSPHFIQSTVAGSVGAYDLPDLAASLAPGKLMLAGVTDGAGTNGDKQIIDNDMSVIRSAYQKRNAADQLHIVEGRSVNQLYDVYKKWIHD